jgi:ABC-type Na+ transport system ATPase subunit NatA
MANAVEVTRLVKRFGKTTALDGVDLVARPGRVLGVLGPNGAGKPVTGLRHFYANDVLIVTGGRESPGCSMVDCARTLAGHRHMYRPGRRGPPTVAG